MKKYGALNSTVKMTSLQGKKPFYKKTFYLDLKGYRQEAQLIKDLKRLGGKQESFLSKEVSFVITSGIHSKHDLINPTPNALSFMMPTPAPTNGNVFRHFDSPPYSSSPVPDEFSFAPAPPPLSRGLSLIQKAKQKKQGTTDVLEVCKQWNIKVIPLQKVLLWLSKNKNLSQRKDEINKRAKAVENQKLEVPFIKVEDVKKIYKTRYKLFDSFYGSIDKDFHRSLRQICKKAQVSKMLDFSSTPSSPVLKERNNRVKEISQLSYFQTPSIGRSTTPTVATVSGQFNINPYASTSIHFSTDKRRESKAKEKENVKRAEKGGHKTSKRKYCEICNSYFMVLDEHLEAQSHKKYLKNLSNFTALSEIVAELPTLEHFLAASKATSNSPGQTCINLAEQDLVSDGVTVPILQLEQDLVPHGVDEPIFQFGQISYEVVAPILQPGQDLVCDGVAAPILQPGQDLVCDGVDEPILQSEQVLIGVVAPILQPEQDLVCDGVDEPILQSEQVSIGVVAPILQPEEGLDCNEVAAPILQPQQDLVFDGVDEPILQSEQVSDGIAAPILQPEQDLDCNGVYAPILQPEDDDATEIDPLSSSDMPRLDTIETQSETDEYSVVDEYISGSCSSPEQLTDFPYLEDTKGLYLVKTVPLQEPVITPEGYHNDVTESFPTKEASICCEANMCPMVDNLWCDSKASCEVYKVIDEVECDVDPVDYSMNHNSALEPLDFEVVKADNVHFHDGGLCKEGELSVMSYKMSVPNVQADTLCLFDNAYSLSETADMVNDKCIPSVAHIQASTKSCSGYQSDGQDVFTSSSGYDIWESIQDEVDSLCKSIGDKENVAMDLSFTKE